MHVHTTPTHKLFITAILIIGGFAIIEAIGGLWAHSLALLGDAGHMASDAVALGIGGFASWVALKPASERHSYGLGRAEVLAAWISSMLMVAISIWIIVEAIHRLEHPHFVKGGIVAIIATIGLVSNIIVAWLLSRGQKTLNVRAAMLHVISDALGSIAAIIAGLVIYFSGWLAIDPILSIFISLLILFSTFNLLRETMAVLMESVPRNIDTQAIIKDLECDDCVSAIHDLHIWTLNSGLVILTAHVDIKDICSWPQTLSSICEVLRTKYNIEHVTLQPETTGCATECDKEHRLCKKTAAPHSHSHHH